MKLSSHFSLEELSNTSNLYLLKKNRTEARNRLEDMECLAWFAEQIRAFLGVPMVVSSAFRCEDLNKAVGGSLNSQHLYARAIDFVPKGISIDECFDILKDSKLVYGQLIKEQSGKSVWIHVGMGDKKENLIYKDGKYTKVL